MGASARSSRAPYWWWLLLPAAVFLAGVANYLFAEVGDDAAATVPRAAIEVDQLELRADRTEGPTLPWGDKGVTLLPDTAPRRPSFESIGSDSGRVLVVDHPAAHIGARVRVYSSSGDADSEDLTPAGSTLFTLTPGGYAYVIAKGASDSETLVIVSGGVESTYTIPLEVNSGAIVVLEGDYFVTTMSGVSDLESETLTVEEQLVPVVLDGVQATDTQATSGLRRGSLVGADGETYVMIESYAGYDVSQSGRSTVERLSDESRVEVPVGSKLLGVDASGRLWVRVPGRDLPARARALAASPGSRDPFDEVLVCGMDGVVVGRILVPVSPWLEDARETVTFTGTGLLVADADDSGLHLSTYEGVAR